MSSVCSARRRGRRRRYNCCTGAEDSSFCSAGTLPSRSGDFIDIYGSHRLVTGVGSDLVHHQQQTGNDPLYQHQFVGGTTGGVGGDKTYITAALVRHIGGSMAVRAAAATAGHQLGDTWDFVPVGSAGGGGGGGGAGSSVDCLGGLGTGNGANALYGYGIVRPADVIVAGGATTTYGTAVTLDSDRSSRGAASSSSRLTTRIYPPMADYVIGSGSGGGGSSSLYGRLPCGCCETYSSSGCVGAADACAGSAASASPSDFKRAATISTFSGSRRQSRRVLVAATGSRGSTDDDADADSSPRRRRNTADGSSSGSKLLLLDADVTAATSSSQQLQQQQQQPISEAYDYQAGSLTSNNASATKSVSGGSEYAAEERSRAEFIDSGHGADGNGNNALSASPMQANSVAVVAPSGYMVPELLSDCTPHGGSRSQYNGSTL